MTIQYTKINRNISVFPDLCDERQQQQWDEEEKSGRRRREETPPETQTQVEALGQNCEILHLIFELLMNKRLFSGGI